ncbi:MAG: methyl-accepting chemotaxis protein [Terriglobales bacterium]
MSVTRQVSNKRGQSGNGYSAVAEPDVVPASRKLTEIQQKAAYLDLVAVPVMAMDREHTILYLNPAAAKMAGQALETSLGAKFWDLFDVPACRAGTCSGARAMREEKTVSGEATAVAQGKQIHLKAHTTPLYGSDHQVIGFLQVLEDIAGQVQVGEEISRLVGASREGQLTERGKADQFEGRYRDMIREVNEMLDAILLPIGEGNRILAQISVGKVDELITQSYKGDHEKMKVAVNNVAVVVQKLRDELGRLIQASRDGQLAERAKSQQFQGAFAELLEGVNEMLDAILLPIGEGNRILAQISAGKVDDLITQSYKGDHEKMKIAVNNVAVVVQKLRDEMGRLIQASRDGQLGERGKPDQFQGAFAELLKGVNQMLDAILLPIGEGNRILAQISAGKIDELITQVYKGDHEKMKIAVNNVAVVVQKLRDEMGRLIQASRDGQLGERGKPDQFQGAFAELLKGVNQMLDAILLPIGEGNRILAQISAGKVDELITQVYKGDHEKMKIAVNSVGTAVQTLVEEMKQLAEALRHGQLDYRGETKKLQGEFANVVVGVNRAIEGMVVPMHDVGAVLDKLAGGDLTAQVTTKYEGDYETLKAAVNQLASQVRTAIGQIAKNVSALASASEELNKVSQQMGSSAEETATQANVVSAASEQVTKNVQTVATGSDEMSASIKEIAKNTAEATRVATAAVKTANSTNETINKLGQSSAEIGQVIKVITSIAQQTNLLALNATIEAARAGEAGKGFAVVANEVKELAKETAKATEDISRKIEAIQGDTSGAVSAIGQISTVIGQISDIQNTIASAMEEQSATTNEIGRNLAEAAKGSTDISKNIGGVAEAARSTAAGAGDTLKSAQSLEKMAADLQLLVGQFRY